MNLVLKRSEVTAPDKRQERGYSQQRKSFAQKHKRKIRWTANSLVRKENEGKMAVGRKVYRASPGQIDVKEHGVAGQCQTVPRGNAEQEGI